MPQQTKTEALEELARLIRRDILNGEAPLNGTWWFDDDTKMQDRIAHVLLNYSDEEKLQTSIGLLPVNRESMMLLVHDQQYARARYEEVVAENKRLTAPRPLRDPRAISLFVDTDMSDPQPGKLLVVRLDDDDVGRGWIPTAPTRGETQNFWPEQRVGFLVETPAVKRVVNEEWVAVRDGRGWTPHFSTPRENPCFATDVESAELFATEEIADARCRMLKGTVGGPWRAVTVDEGRKIAAEVVPFAISKEVLP